MDGWMDAPKVGCVVVVVVVVVVLCQGRSIELREGNQREMDAIQARY